MRGQRYGDSFKTDNASGNAVVVNSPAFAHGHHAHGAPMTEVEQKRQRVCLMTCVYAIALTDWDGMWQSVYPYGQRRAGPTIFRQRRRKKDPEKTFEDIKRIIAKDTRRMLNLLALKVAL